MSAERFEAAVEFGRSADALTTRSKEQVEEQPEQISHNIINQLHTETFNPREKATPYFFYIIRLKKLIFVNSPAAGIAAVVAGEAR